MRLPTCLLTCALLLLVSGCDSPVDYGGDPDPAPEATVLAAPAPGGPSAVAGSTPHEAAILGLLAAFHEAIRDSEAGQVSETMRSLWTEDARFSGLGQQAEGPAGIAELMVQLPPWGKGWAALAPTYKTTVDIQGNRAMFAFECVYVPDTGNLAGQSVAAHLSATGIARKVGDRWLFQEFNGAPGPLP